ncbi:protein CDV3 homolog isoform 1-T1 [Salvelinus alpinus]|uniref:Protein CDV3 homolog isoform X1 n=1 Tax=Salvelinus namaycush TaxID=8040 RepID=A0A8U0PRL3_SALNM|nr:protein CDV3 homolog isoform X1 [Salvelinus namaycush]XP_055737043.1 protein CDV3 homolog isoform X1 [Salvelinus fontinalis]
MADVETGGAAPEKSLDDFFAKRDKKKKKEKGGKGKEVPSGPTPIVLKKNKKEKEKFGTKNENQDAQPEKDDEEWKEFEAKEVDYSGLRLQALQISDEKEEDEYEEEVGEDGEIILVSGDKMSGPWNKSGAPPPAAAPVEVEEVPESKPSGVYRPPGARLTTTKRGHNQGPPEIFSDTQFPSLMAGSKHVETRRDRELEKTFEVVKHKNRGREEGGSGASLQQLELGNQYAILGDK